MKEEKVKWEEIPSPLQNYFISHWLMSAVFCIIVMAIAFSSRLYKIFFSLTALGLINGLYILYLYIQTTQTKMMMYVGICESVKKEKLSIPSPNPLKKTPFATIYGKSQLTMKIDGINYVVPISQRFEAEPGNEIQVYTLNSGIFEINNNSYLINNPILVWKSKL